MNRKKQTSKSVVFFTYLPLEYGGGVAKFYRETAAALRKGADIRPVIVTLTPRFARKVLAIYSLYFLGRQDTNIANKETAEGVIRRKKSVTIVQTDSLDELKDALQHCSALYMNNNILELWLLQHFIGIQSLPPVIIGFHSPTIYPFAGAIHERLHNKLYTSHIYRTPVSKAFRLHVINEFDLNHYRKWLPHADIRLVRYFYDTAQARRNARTSAVALPDRRRSSKRIAWIGRLTAQKGVRELCDAVDHIQKSSHAGNFTFVIAGEGELKKDILALEKNYRNVKYLGYVQNADIPGVLSRCDAYLNTSRWETFPFTVLESFAVGTPVFAFDIPGIHDMINAGESGCIYKNLRDMNHRIATDLLTMHFDRKTVQNHMDNLINNRQIYRDMTALLSV